MICLYRMRDRPNHRGPNFYTIRYDMPLYKGAVWYNRNDYYYLEDRIYSQYYNGIARIAAETNP